MDTKDTRHPFCELIYWNDLLKANEVCTAPVHPSRKQAKH